MRDYFALVRGKNYAVGCTGQTVYLLTKGGTELARFRDIRYGYLPLICPSREIAVVKSTAGALAVYDLENRKLIKKVRTVTGAPQDDGMCFSADGNLLLDLEAQEDLTTSVVVYSETFEEQARIPCANITLQAIERAGEGYFVLGYTRDEAGVFDKGFIAPFDGKALGEKRFLPEKKYNELMRFKSVERTGFTRKAVAWSHMGEMKGPTALCEIYEKSAPQNP